MSTAIMSQNTLYDFGDSVIKNGMTSPEGTPGGHLAVGSTAMRLSLTRMASTPGTSNALAVALLDKFTQHHHQQQQQHRRLERTQSAPAPPTPSNQPSANSQLSPSATNTSRYKTELCRPYEEFGVCKYGDKCQFAHGIGELRSLARHPKYKTELCRTFHSVGFCPYGPRCHFVHNQDEVLQKNPTAAALLTSSPRPCPTNSIVRPKPVALTPAPIPIPPTALTPAAALSPSLSLDSPSPPSSLSQSPTSSLGSFFSSESELHSPLSPEEQRLPVFNRLSAADIFSLTDLILH